MDKETQYVRRIGRKQFSNRNYTIRIVFYEHEMAHINIIIKRGGAYYPSPGKYRPFTIFDQCRRESMWDLWDCLDLIRHDRVARRWLERTMRCCTQQITKPNGRYSLELANAWQDEGLYEGTHEYKYSFGNEAPEDTNWLWGL